LLVGGLEAFFAAAPRRRVVPARPACLPRPLAVPRVLPDLAERTPPFPLADPADRPPAEPDLPAPVPLALPRPVPLALPPPVPEPRRAPPPLALPGGGIGSITSGDSSWW
jgi:hypothetical protein